MRLLLVLLLVGSAAVAQDTLFKLPKYPPKLKMTTRDAGIRPGTPVGKNDPSTTSFKRIYSKPAGLRLLVRVPCNSRMPSDKDLIERAGQISEAGGPPVQIDWEPVYEGEVRYVAVVYSERIISAVDLTARNGKYAVARTSKLVEDGWSVQPLDFIGVGACIEPTELTQRQMKVAVINILNTASLANFRAGG